MNKFQRYEIFYKLYKDNPCPKIELTYTSSFELLIAVILSAQSTDKQVNKVTSSLFTIISRPQDVINLGFNRLAKNIRSIGLYNKKAKNIIETSKLLLKYHNGVVPNNRISLEKLPGVGRKTSNIILNAIFNCPTIAVDTHVFRVCNRTKIAVGNNVIKVEKKLLSIVPKQFKMYCHYWLVLHGRYICTARNPKCNICIINRLCEFENKK